MPTLKEIKDMLVKAEQEAESAIEAVFEGKVAAPLAAANLKAEGIEAAEPVFVTEKAYGQVDGIPGVKYQQDGEYFDSQRQFVRKA